VKNPCKFSRNKKDIHQLNIKYIGRGNHGTGNIGFRFTFGHHVLPDMRLEEEEFLLFLCLSLNWKETEHGRLSCGGIGDL